MSDQLHFIALDGRTGLPSHWQQYLGPFNTGASGAADGDVDNLPTMLIHSVTGHASPEPPTFSDAQEVMSYRLAMAALSSVDAAVSVVEVTVPDHPVVFVNAAFCSLTGYDRSEALGRNCRFLQHASTDRAALALIRESIAAGRPVQTVLRNQRRDGTSFWNALKLVPLAQDDGRVTHYVGFQHDLSDWALPAQVVLSMDEMGASRALARFEHAMTAALREQASGRHRWVLAHLRATSNPIASDVALPLSQREAVTSGLRPFLSVGAALHFAPGGSVAVLVPIAGDQTPSEVVTPLLQAVQAVWPCRAGMAELGVDGTDAETLLTQARLACNRAVEESAKTPCYAAEVRNLADLRTQQLLRDVRGALECGQFRLVFQPVVELANGELRGFEALLRWRHPELGQVMPGEFIAQLERMPEMGRVTRWVLTTALEHLGRWCTALGRSLRMAVNLPAELLLDDDFTLFALAELDRQQINPRQLELELTERSLANANGPAVTRLRELHGHGVQIAIDDFGTGWSSLAYLAQLPVTTLKVDQQFTRGVTFNRADAAISRMTVELARGLGLRCVVEGIERPGQVHFFSDLRCHEAQGYLFAKPLEVEAVDRWMLAPTPFIAPDLQSGSAAPGVRHLLILDDEENVLRSLRRTLRPAGFQIHITTSPEQAFEILALHPVGVILSDQRMPGMTGTEFLRRVKDKYPLTRRIVLSGYTDLQSITEAINQGAIYKFLTKPWSDTDLLATLETAFAEFELGAENQRLHDELQQAHRRLGDVLVAQGQRMSHGETALDVMHAALSSVAVPVMGLDSAGALMMINEAAERLFAPAVALLGEPASQLLGFEPTRDQGESRRCMVLGHRSYAVHCTALVTCGQDQGLMLTFLEGQP